MRETSIFKEINSVLFHEANEGLAQLVTVSLIQRGRADRKIDPLIKKVSLRKINQEKSLNDPI